MTVKPLLFALLVLLGQSAMAGCSDTRTGSAPKGDDALAIAQPSVQMTRSTVPRLPSRPYNYADPKLPAHFRRATGPSRLSARAVPMNQDNTPADNPVTDAGATLGRVLFYDVGLSKNRSTSCGSCHLQRLAFSDNAVLSAGFKGGRTARHSMRLSNARFYKPGMFFWDQRAATLEKQVLMPLLDPVEMGMTLSEVEARVKAQAYYKPLFSAAFGDSGVTSDRVAKALAQFVRSMISASSPYDVARAKAPSAFVDFPEFTASENRGKTLFNSPPPRGGLGCLLCHGGDAQLALQSSSNGLDPHVTDPGYGDISAVRTDMGTFKVPSLRNVALSPPYMHDGRFATLEQVVEHYSTGLNPHHRLPRGLFPRVDGKIRQRNLTAQQKVDLVAFMKTLDDQTFVTDPKFSDPFLSN